MTQDASATRNTRIRTPHAFGVVRLLQQLTGTFEDRDLVLQLPDPPFRRGEFTLFSTSQAGRLPGVDQILFAPGVDRLVTDAQIRGDLCDRAPGGGEIKHLAAKLIGVPLRHEHVSFGNVVTRSQPN